MLDPILDHHISISYEISRLHVQCSYASCSVSRRAVAMFKRFPRTFEAFQSSAHRCMVKEEDIDDSSMETEKSIYSYVSCIRTV
jgi:hypothetical protein